MMRERQASFTRIDPLGGRGPVTRAVAVEAPIAMEINGIGYAVMMATPADLVDFGYGFIWSERLVDARDEILGVEHFESEIGHRLRMELVPERTEGLAGRFRPPVCDFALR